VAASIQMVVYELKHRFVSQTVIELLDEPVVFKHIVYKITFFLLLVWKPLVGLGLLIHEVCFLDHTWRHTTVGRTPLDESAHCRDLYLTTHTTLTTDRHPCPWWDSNPQS